MQCDIEVTSEVAAVGEIHIEGNVVVLEWYKHLKTDSGKPDAIAVSLLADIVYWYRPTQVRCESTGDVIGYRKKFRADLLQRNYDQFENQFGYSTKQIREALTRLEKAGLIRRVFRNIESNGVTLPNVMFIQIYPAKLKEITKQRDISKKGNISFQKREHILPSTDRHPSEKGNTYTEATTKTTTNTLSMPKTAERATASGREREMIEIWNQVMEAQSSLTVSQKKKQQLRTVLDQHFEGSMEQWKSYCQKMQTSDFLMGKGKASSFKALLDWATKPDTIEKVREGGYGIRTSNAQAKPEESNTSFAEKQLAQIQNPEWRSIQKQLYEHYGAGIFKSWFSKISMQKMERESKTVILSVPTQFIKEYVRQHYQHILKSLWSKVLGEGALIEVMVEQ